MSDYLRKLIESDPLQEQVVRQAIRALQPLPGSRGLDVGCGYGAQAALLAEAVGPEGHVTGLDISREFLHHGRKIVEKAGLQKRVTLCEGDMNHLPFEGDSFHWAWSMNCVGYPHGNPMPTLGEMMRVVKPGGFVTIIAWSSEQLLPGYPELEARLRATAAGIAPFERGEDPEMHFLRAPGWFHHVGLEAIESRTFVKDVQAPLDEDNRRALLGLFEMRWPGVKSELAEEEWAELQRLTRPNSPDLILDLPEYYAFFTYTMFTGRVPE